MKYQRYWHKQAQTCITFERSFILYFPNSKAFVFDMMHTTHSMRMCVNNNLYRLWHHQPLIIFSNTRGTLLLLVQYLEQKYFIDFQVNVYMDFNTDTLSDAKRDNDAGAYMLDFIQYYCEPILWKITMLAFFSLFYAFWKARTQLGSKSGCFCWFILEIIRSEKAFSDFLKDA